MIMETYELEEKVYAALTADDRLIELLANGAKSIFHYVAPSTLKYPAIVYSPISDVPALSGDNREVAHRVTIRIHVITSAQGTKADQEKFREVCVRVKEIMTTLEFARRQTVPFINDGRAMFIYDFVKGV